MHAIIEDLAPYGENPHVQLFYGARTADELHDLDNLRKIAADNPWLSVTPVVENDAEEVDAEQGTLVDVVTAHGAWAEREVLVSGSPAMIRATVSKMLVAGTPLDRIQYDPFTMD